MNTTIAWIDGFQPETRAWRDQLQLSFPYLHFQLYERAGEAYTGFQAQRSDIVVINPWLALGLDCPYAFPLEGLDKPSRIGFDLATRIRAMDQDVPIIILGWGSEIKYFREGEELRIKRSNPCPEAAEIVDATKVLPNEFTEIMRKYVGRA